MIVKPSIEYKPFVFMLLPFWESTELMDSSLSTPLLDFFLNVVNVFILTCDHEFMSKFRRAELCMRQCWLNESPIRKWRS